MPNRFLFRLTYGANIETYLNDGEIRSKLHPNVQLGYRTSYRDLVAQRDEFVTPCGNSVNNFVPFYFSPSTAMALAINADKVRLVGPASEDLGTASLEDIVYIVADPTKVAAAGSPFWFSDIACNSAQTPRYCSDITQLESHVDWALFDDFPRMGRIAEIGYDGVCKYSFDSDRKSAYLNRKKKRMAEFMVQNTFSMDLVECLVIKSTKWERFLTDRIALANRNIPVYVKSGCFF